MNKESFLKELQSGLAVLAESEQQDILGEYAQHIDMRVANGLTEEEAIQDFGDIRQLTEEILEAYHVNPSYGTGGAGSSGRTLPRLPDPRPALAQTGSFFLGVGRKIAGALVRAGHAISALPRRFVQWIGSLSARRSQTFAASASEGGESSSMHPAVKNPSHSSSSGQRRSALRRGLRQAGRGMVRLGRLTAWLLWNAALLLCALPFVGVGLLALIGLGVLVVWLAQGLPLAGAVLSCVGVLAVCAGALGLGSGLIWHRRRAVPVSQDPDGALSQPAAAQDERKKRGDLG